MDLPVMPPVAPMLAKPVPELPEGPWSFEPKWDGFRTIVVPDAEGRRLDFEALLLRIHPAASRVRLLAAQTPARLVAFDLLALGGVDHMGEPFARRRAALEQALAGVEAPVHLTPATTD